MNFGIDLMVPAKFALLMNDQIYIQLGTNFDHLKEVPPEVENQLKKMKEDFMILHEKIQSKADFLLNCPVRYGLKNFPYLVKSENDNVWYRLVKLFLFLFFSIIFNTQQSLSYNMHKFVNFIFFDGRYSFNKHLRKFIWMP